jgi:CBS domain-containing protein
MKHHTVADVMTTDVVTVITETPFKDLAALFVEQKISALPVLGRDGTVTGIVRDTDLLKKEELQRDLGAGRGTVRPLRWRRGLHAIADGSVAGEVMTTRVVTVPPGAPLAEAARLMDKHRTTCLPVVAGDGTLAGVVTPRDLLRVFLRPDDDIRDEIVREVLQNYLGTDPMQVRVDVRHGLVAVTGEVAHKSMIELVLPLVRAVDGVVDATADLSCAADDSPGPAATPRIPSWPIGA